MAKRTIYECDECGKKIEENDENLVRLTLMKYPNLRYNIKENEDFKILFLCSAKCLNQVINKNYGKQEWSRIGIIFEARKIKADREEMEKLMRKQ